jgi:hypothetical protein
MARRRSRRYRREGLGRGASRRLPSLPELLGGKPTGLAGASVTKGPAALCVRMSIWPFGSATGPLTCCSIWRDPIDSPRFTPFAPSVLRPPQGTPHLTPSASPRGPRPAGLLGLLWADGDGMGRLPPQPFDNLDQAASILEPEVPRRRQT